MRLAAPFLLALLLVAAPAKAQEESYDQNALDSASLPVEHRSGGSFGPQLGGPPLGGPHLGGVPQQLGPDDPWPLTQPDMPTIKNLQVQCEKAFMRVSVEFDRPFYGMIFSKGFYSDPNCVHVQPETGTLQAQFDIYLNNCGMTSSSNSANVGQPTPSGTFIENTVIIQYDPLVQEVWDAARKLRCTWYDYYEKSVTFRPFQVDMLNAVTANFLGDNLQCWMQIQVGKGPWASEVSGIVKIGQTMTMVLAIKDDENKFDMMVRNCVAHDGNRPPIQLVDEKGCVTRPKIMGRFQKIKNFGSSASVVSYAYFQAFKFPDSMNVHFQCVIQVCRYNCPEPQCGGVPGGVPVPPTGYIPAGSENVPSSVLPAHPDPRRPVAAALSDNKVPVENVAVAQNVQRKAGEGPVHVVDTDGGQPVPLPVPIALKGNNLHIRPTYTNINRQGNAKDSLEGRPRSVNFDNFKTEEEEDEAGEGDKSRTRRTVSRQRVRRAVEMTDVSTMRIIQVVAPGDVDFDLNAANETVIVSKNVPDSSNICMSTTGFAAGLIMMLLVLIIACLVAFFLYTRVRAFNSKGSVSSFVQGFDNPEFVKVGPTN
ncbi:transmembrane protein dusky-like [Oratosquilla oratoria]|uniref:transmembrane protein dusky-like n=1 Tax=Oratosquilla oratoria TaxID=337810 RepID=UPI003F75D23F